MDRERNLSTTYRVVPTKDNYYSVLVYPKSPAEISEKIYREDMLPSWLRDAMVLLDCAGVGHDVLGIGAKVGETYWVVMQKDA
jgi:hypothetical protein